MGRTIANRPAITSAPLMTAPLSMRVGYDQKSVLFQTLMYLPRAGRHK
jgi:hypothetical protein